MRQSEREARLGALCERLFAGAERLELGAGSAAGEPGPSWQPSRRYGAALWRLSSDTSGVRAGLAIVRRALTPGARLLLLAPRRAPLLRQLRGALGGEQAPRAHLEPLCEGLLLAGFHEPRVHELFADAWTVSGQLASAIDPLDAFFEQPASSPGR